VVQDNSAASASQIARINFWIGKAVDSDASDLHLIPGYPPVIRVHGNLVDLDEPILDDQAILDLIATYCPDGLAERHRIERNVDFSFEATVNNRTNRFRTNLFFTDEHPAACLRVVPPAIPDFDWAGFPPDLADRMIGLRDELVIVTGMTGSGKTTTLAMIVEQFKRLGGKRIITVELDPHRRRHSAREIGNDRQLYHDSTRRRNAKLRRICTAHVVER
jgi:twitching motility protein PilT